MVAREEDLATLANEARARGLSLGRMLGEVVADRAEQLRSEHRPRLATFSADTSIAAASEDENPAMRPFRTG